MFVGGTTHPMMTLRLLVDGFYDATTGLYCLEGNRNEHRYYIATDNLLSPLYRGLTPGYVNICELCCLILIYINIMTG